MRAAPTPLPRQARGARGTGAPGGSGAEPRTERHGALRTTQAGRCAACGGLGPVEYSELRDDLFHSDGTWQMRRCGRCRTLWLDPQPIAEDIHLAYRAYHTHGDDGGASRRGLLGGLVRLARAAYIDERYGYAVTGLSPTARKLFALWVRLWAGQREEADIAVAFQPAGPPVSLLDVGCGDGSFLEFATSLGWSAVGVDPDPAAVAAARRRGVQAMTGGLESQGYPSGRFDVIVLNHVIEHVHEPVRLLCECRRLLTEGGRVVIATPNAQSALHLRYREHWRGLEPPRHLRVYSLEGLESDLRSAGLTPSVLVTTVRGAAYVTSGSRALRRGRQAEGLVARMRERLIAEALQAALAARLHEDPRAGQEILAVAAG